MRLFMKLRPMVRVRETAATPACHGFETKQGLSQELLEQGDVPVHCCKALKWRDVLKNCKIRKLRKTCCGKGACVSDLDT